MKMHARIDVSPVAQAAALPRRANDDRPEGRGMPRAAAAPALPDPDRARYEPYPWSCLLDRYLEGWAEANLGKIFAATTHGYCFDDPLVGQFSRWNFPAYFERLQARYARAGATGPQDLAFVIRGPMDGPLQPGPLKFFRASSRKTWLTTSTWHATYCAPPARTSRPQNEYQGRNSRRESYRACEDARNRR